MKLSEKIAIAIDNEKWETAQRMATAILKKKSSDFDVLLHQHKALYKLGDLRSAMACLQSYESKTDDECFSVALLISEDYYALRIHNHYRCSKESKEGLSVDEYETKYIDLAKGVSEKITSLAVKLGREDELEELKSKISRRQYNFRQNKVAEVKLPDDGTASVKGRIYFPDGSAAVNLRIVLGLEVISHGCFVVEGEDNESHPIKFKGTGCDYAVSAGSQRSRETLTDKNGYFCFRNIPEGRHEFIAACLDPFEDNIACYFLAHNIIVGKEDVEMELTIESWKSAESYEVQSPFENERLINGVYCSLFLEEKFHNPFFYDFPLQQISLKIPDELNGKKLFVICSCNEETIIPSQIADNELSFMVELPMKSDRTYAIYSTDDDTDFFVVKNNELTINVSDDGSYAVISTGCADFKIAWENTEEPSAPIQQVRGVDGVWRGEGRLLLPQNIIVKKLTSQILKQGDVYIEVELTYDLSNGDKYSFVFTAQGGESVLLAHEIAPDLDGAAFEFSLKEFYGGRGFLHWTPENGNVHWCDIKGNKELARLQESVPWWIPPCGFGYAVTSGNLVEKDYIAVVTLRRGEWVDRYFEKICKGPVENRELDWPYPEMVGSTVSMITVRSDESGDVFFRFKAFDGERYWGLMVSDFNRNDGIDKEIASVQHKNSSPRLQDFKHWKLDFKDNMQRPFILAKHDNLIDLRKKGEHPLFAEYRKNIADYKHNRDVSAQYFDAMLSASPLRIWAMKKFIAGVAETKARMILLGRDRGDFYSPVGSRCIAPYVEGFDSIVATGVFTEKEERSVRAYLILMGHMFMEPDLMNWHFNSRNANFEADRAEVVSTVGIGFHSNPDAKKFIDHSLSLMERSLNVYTNPDSGKWYENPACYYQVSARARLTMIHHFKEHNIADCTDIPRLKPFFSWALNLITPPYPAYNVLRDGCTSEDYDLVEKCRRIPPIGDHASIGSVISELFAIAGKLYRERDPEFAEMLTWLYQNGKGKGGNFARTSMFFATMDENDLKPAKAPVLSSRKLEGFGSVFRGNFNQPNEFYLLLKLGPGGYRYHNTEGSIILFANGKPLIFDGGEAGETWRHTTLSFGRTHQPQAPGHIERFVSFTSVDFSQGVSPKALLPGEPIQLNDSCEHELVDLAEKRFSEPNPVNSRSVTWIKNKYIILYDQLNLQDNRLTHWHLQAVADEHTGDWQNGYRFKGRFGTDLQVLLPDQTFEAEKIRQETIFEYKIPEEECFSMRHLQLSSTAPDYRLAVLRPLNKNDQPVKASLIKNGNFLQGVKVSGEDIDDIHWLDRNGTEFSENGISFKGRYGSVIRRGNVTYLNILDGEYIQLYKYRLCCKGASASLTISEKEISIEADGIGTLEITGMKQPILIILDDGDSPFEKSWEK